MVSNVVTVSSIFSWLPDDAAGAESGDDPQAETSRAVAAAMAATPTQR